MYISRLWEDYIRTDIAVIKFADMELQKAKENMKAGKCSWVYRMLLELLEPQRLPVE